MNASASLIGALQSPADGAQPILLAATDPRPGAYYGPTRRGAPPDQPDPPRCRRGALVPDVGARLWEMSTELTGVALEP